jgi:Domain of unknown function (DUF1772)
MLARSASHDRGGSAAAVAARLLPSLTVALAAVFFGIAVYINVAEQPARLALDNGPMLAQWKISFGMGIRIQGTLAIVTGLTALATWWLARDWRWLAGGLLMLANWPWTMVMIASINSELLTTAIDAAGPSSSALIEQWGQVHAVRTGLGLAATLLFVCAASQMRRAV